LSLSCELPDRAEVVAIEGERIAVLKGGAVDSNSRIDFMSGGAGVMKLPI
jgi:hypothetical protein